MCHAELAKRLPDGFGRNAKSGGALILILIGMIPDILRKFLKINLEPLTAIIGLRIKAL